MSSFNVVIAPNLGQNSTGINNQRRVDPSWPRINVVLAIFESVDNGRATLRSVGDDVVFTADASNIKGNVGEQLTFNVNRDSDNNLILSQIVRRSAEEKAHLRGELRKVGRAMANATPADEMKAFSQTLEDIKETEELRVEHRKAQDAKVAKALAAIRRVQNGVGVTTQSAMRAVAHAGIDLSKISFQDMQLIMQEADKKPEGKIPHSIFKEGMGKNFAKPENAEAIVTSLYDNGVDITDKTIKTMETAWDRLPEKVPEPAVKDLLYREKDITLENVYTSVSQTKGVKQSPVVNQAAADLPQDILIDFFVRENIDATPDNITTARYLLGRDLPLSMANIEKVQFLQNFTNMPSETNHHAVSRELFFDKAANFMSTSRPIGNIHLRDVTQFARAQLKMAWEAAKRMQGKLDNLSSELTDRVEHLKDHLKNLQVNEDSAMRYLRMVGAGTQPAYTTKMTDLFQSLANINPLTANVHVGIMKGTIPFTIHGVNESVKAARAMAHYDQYATVPDPKYGDSFNKVKGQFSPLLEDLNIAVTTENLKAAFILSKNNMDVNEDNLGPVKEIEAKVTAIASKLHPMIAANMIKEGLNPLEMHADQVLEYIKKFNITMGEDKLSRYIMEMDDAGNIEPETRKSMIAMYRMLNVIRRDGASALGLAAEMEGLKTAPMTLGDLLNLAQTKKIDMHVSDEKTQMGQLESLAHSPDSIRGALAGTTSPTVYGDILADNLIDMASPETLQRLLNDPDAMKQALEELVQQQNPTAGTTNANAMAQIQNQVQAQIQAFISANPEAVHFLQSRGISATPGNIRAFEKLSNSRRALADVLEEWEGYDSKDDASETLPTTQLEELKNGKSPAQILARIVGNLSDRTSPTQGRRTSLESLLAVTHGLNADGRQGFQLPVKMGSKVSNLSLHVLNKHALTEDGARILMSLDTLRLGTVNAYFTLNGGVIDVTVSAPSREAVELLQEQQFLLEALLSTAGAEVGELSFFTDKESTDDTALPPDALLEMAGTAVKPQTAYDFWA